MKQISILFFILGSLFTNANNDSCSVGISVPQNSGWAFVQYKDYFIKGGKFYQLDRIENIPFTLGKSEEDTSTHWVRVDTLLTYVLSPTEYDKFDSLISQIDSVQHHTDFNSSWSGLGWPRFIMTFYKNGKGSCGYMASCYKEEVFDIIDFFNQVNPNGDIVGYDRKELIESMKDKRCREY